MKKLIEITLEGIDIYHIKTNDVKKYLVERGIKPFRYDDEEDYGEVVGLIYTYLNENNINY
jgi:hypothetical protein